MTQLGDSLDDLFESLLLAAGVTLTVRRGTETPVQVDAIRGRAITSRWSGDESFYGTSHQDDFIVRVADYIAKVGSEPEINDQFEWTDDRGATRSFRVCADGSERHWDPVGQFGLLMRVHTTEL